MDLFKTAIISLFVISLIAIVSVSVTAHLTENYTGNETTTNSDESFFDEMKEMHEAMHPGSDFEEFHQALLGDDWEQEMQDMHQAMVEGNFDEMAQDCPMMNGNFDSEDMQAIHESMHGMMR
ncbi:hypothetical protein KKG83_02335 [Candidatus Micrarchaeota archaeon]|nr:hypothetical protein [Candidatus Micrarchaeota archaeon]MBU2476289.1 hypothetical protein [Candidatus Micrarchaeota archaeon]